MEGNQIILQGISEASLVGRIKLAIKEVLEENTVDSDSTDKIGLLTRDEVCQLLKINRTTLWSYTKQKKLKSYGIGNRVY